MFNFFTSIKKIFTGWNISLKGTSISRSKIIVEGFDYSNKNIEYITVRITKNGSTVTIATDHNTVTSKVDLIDLKMDTSPMHNEHDNIPYQPIMRDTLV